MRRLSLMTVAACAALMFGTAVHAQQPVPAAAPPPAPPPYGEPITLEQAKKVAAAAEAEAKKLNLNDAIAIVEPNGQLVYFQKMDNTQYLSVTIAQHKARAAASFRRETRVFEDNIQLRQAYYALTIDGIVASRGGIPLLEGGKLIGAIGCSGATGSQDEVVCKAGAAIIK